MKRKYVEKINEGSVYPLKSVKGNGNTWGHAFYYRLADERKRKTVTGKSVEELMKKAEEFLDKTEREYENSLKEDEAANEESIRPKTFKEAGMEWFDSYKNRMEKAGKSYASIESRQYSLVAINKVAASVAVSDIDSSVAAGIIEACSIKPDGGYYSRSHVDKIQQVFQMVMRYAVDRGYCQKVPDKAELGENLTTVDKDSRFMDEEMIGRLIKAVKGNRRYTTIIYLLLATGLRQEEAFALNIKDFNVKNDGTVEVKIYKTVVETEGHVYKVVQKTKTRRSRRTVCIPMEVYEMVSEYYNDTVRNETKGQKEARERNGMDGYIFVNKDMKPLNKRTFQRNIKKYIERKCGGEMDQNMTMHMLRHTFASIQAEEMGLDKVALLMGDSIETVNGMYQSLTRKTKAAVCRNSSNLLKILSVPEQ